MAISQVGSTTTAKSAAANSVSCSKPTGVSSGDVLLALVTSNDGTITSSGWTEIGHGSGQPDLFNSTWLYKVAGGSEPSSYSFSTSDASSPPMIVTITAWSGVDTTNGPIAATNKSGSNFAGTSGHSEPLTIAGVTNTPDALPFYSRACRVSRSGTSVITTFAASGVTELVDTGQYSGGSVTYSHAIYIGTEASGNAPSLAVTATNSFDESDNVTAAFTLYALATATNAPAEAPDATGAANDPTASLSAQPDTPNATAAANASTASLGTAPATPNATAAALDATVSAISAGQGNAECPNATAAALDATVSITVTAEAPSSSAAAGDTGWGVTAAVATATATAYDGTGSLGAAPSVATATGAGSDGSDSVSSTASVATALADATDSTVQITNPIAYFGSGTGFVTGGNTVDISTPASIPAGAVIVLCAGGFCASATPTPSGSGWTLVDTQATGSARFWTWVKVATGGEGTITVTMDGNALYGGGGCSVYTNVDTSDPVVAHDATVWAGVTHTSLTSVSVNNTGNGTECAVFTGAFYNGSTGHGQTTPTNMTQAFEAGDGSEASTFTFYRLNAPTGAQSYSTSTTGGQSDWYGGDGLLFLRAVSGTNATAAAAASTGAANDASAALTSTAEAPNGTGVAQDATPSLAPVAGAPNASASALDATALTGTQAPAECPNATAAGQDAATSVQANVEVPNATAAALDATVLIGPAAGLATATADAYDGATASDGQAVAGSPDAPTAAYDATAAVTVNAECPNATASALDATVDTVILTNAPAEAPDAQATAYDASVSVSADAGLAAAQAHAYVSLSAPNGQCDAYDATVIVGPAVEAPGATAAAYDASVDITVNADCPNGGSAGVDPVVSRNISVNAEVATAFATCYGALGFGYNVTTTDNYTYVVDGETRVLSIERESRVYAPAGDWNAADSILA